MKPHLWIWFVITMVCAACTKAPHTSSPDTLDRHLVVIDTLMQSRPDSALILLMDTTLQDPYYQLLLSEALYKNDYAQANRAELLDAMAYFDSIGEPFLSARCHYMNGVGYYEIDSVVPACAEYLKALEIMEEHFEEKDLVGNKAKYMALTYSRLCELFTKQYLHLQAVEVAQKSYEYYQKFESLSWQSAWVLNTIGSNYHAMEQLDSACYYYQKAAAVLNDSVCLLYRDISEHLALIDYEMGVEPQKQLLQLKYLLSLSKTNNEYYTRCLAVGEVLYHETELDTAQLYLEEVFVKACNVAIKKQAAEFLMAIHSKKEEFTEASSYADYLAPFANLDENLGNIKSQLVDAYQKHEQNTKESQQQQLFLENRKQVVLVLIVIAFIIVLFVILYFLRTKQLKNERLEHEIKRAALSGRLKQSNAALKKERENRKGAFIPQIIHPDSGLDFQEEPICQHIHSVCNNEKNPIKTNIPISSYANIALTHTQEAQLKEAVDRHYSQLFEKLKLQYPMLKRKDFQYCYLCLLGLDNTQIAAMTQLSYRTIWEREKRLQSVFNTNSAISVFLHSLLIK